LVGIEVCQMRVWVWCLWWQGLENPQKIRWGDWWSHQSFFDGTLIDQSVVVTLNGVFHDGSEGDGLIGALAVMLDLRDQFHRLLTEADAELLRSIGMVVHFC
jgi:hypothetical protein